MDSDGCGCITVHAIDFAHSSKISNVFWPFNQCFTFFLVFSNATILHDPPDDCWFVIFDLNQIFLIKISPNFFLFLEHILVMVMWSGVLMKSLTSKWSSLIFLMAAPLSWLMNNCGPWSSQVIMSTSLHTIYIHIHTRASAISAMVQMHYYNYQSAPQPPNSGIHLNSVTWHSSDRGSTCARL